MINEIRELDIVQLGNINLILFNILNDLKNENYGKGKKAIENEIGFIEEIILKKRYEK